jgi:hypothetical protein
MMEKKQRERLVGAIFFLLFFVLILSGIVAKRIYGHPDWMVFFHLPAAVFLVLAGRTLSRPIRERHRLEMKRIREQNH